MGLYLKLWSTKSEFSIDIGGRDLQKLFNLLLRCCFWWVIESNHCCLLWCCFLAALIFALPELAQFMVSDSSWSLYQQEMHQQWPDGIWLWGRVSSFEFHLTILFLCFLLRRTVQFICQGILPIGPGVVLPVSGVALVSAETVQLSLHGEGGADGKSK